MGVVVLLAFLRISFKKNSAIWSFMSKWHLIGMCLNLYYLI